MNAKGRGISSLLGKPRTEYHHVHGRRPVEWLLRRHVGSPDYQICETVSVGPEGPKGCIYFCLVQRLQCIIKSSLQYIFGHGTAITRTILPKNRAVTLDRISVFRIYLPGMKYNWFRKQLYGVLGCSARTSIPFGRGPGDSSQREGR
jgi:hypothetical protein